MGLADGCHIHHNQSNLLTCWNDYWHANGSTLFDGGTLDYGSTQKAVARLKANKAADDAGLVAELLHHSPEVLLEGTV